MIRASGNSPRIAMIASIPGMSGICRSIRVTSGRCARNNSTASRPVDASATNCMSDSAPINARMPFRNNAWSSTARTRIGFLSSGHDSTLFFRNSRNLSPAMRCSVSNSGRNGQFRFRARARFAPEFQSRPDAFRALAYTRQAPMPLARASLQDLAVDALSIIANPQPEEMAVIRDFSLDAACARVVKGVAQDLARNPVDLVLKERRQAAASLLPQ